MWRTSTPQTSTNRNPNVKNDRRNSGETLRQKENKKKEKKKKKAKKEKKGQQQQQHQQQQSLKESEML